MKAAERWSSSCDPDRQLHEEFGGSAVVQAVHGVGWVGKTSAAIEYAHRYIEEYDVA